VTRDSSRRWPVSRPRRGGSSREAPRARSQPVVIRGPPVASESASRPRMRVAAPLRDFGGAPACRIRRGEAAADLALKQRDPLARPSSTRAALAQAWHAICSEDVLKTTRQSLAIDAVRMTWEWRMDEMDATPPRTIWNSDRAPPVSPIQPGCARNASDAIHSTRGPEGALRSIAHGAR
jgi:hypothetical protein